MLRFDCGETLGADRSRPRRAGRRELAVLVATGIWLLGAELGHAAEWWSVADSATGTRVALDTSRLVCARGVCSVDQRTMQSQGDDRGVGRINTVRYDCAGLRVQDSAGGAGGWRMAPPNSLSEALLTFACTFQQRTNGLGDSDVMDADGRKFERAAKSVKTGAPPATHSAPIETAGKLPALKGRFENVAVQVAAAASQAQAASDLSRLSQQNRDLLGALSTQIQPADATGGRVYRALFTGFSSFGAARQVCAALKGRGIACFVKFEAEP